MASRPEFDAIVIGVGITGVHMLWKPRGVEASD